MPKVRNLVAALPEAECIDIQDLRRAYLFGEVDLVCVLGPTASGKTRYSVDLAHQLGMAEIISADSRQVYRGMDIGTGKDLEEYGDIPFHLIDIADPGDGYNVFRFQQDFLKAYSDIRSRGCIPILCGGTGMYINAVTRAYDFKGNIPLSAPREQIRDSVSGPVKPYFIGTLVSREVRNQRIDARLDARLKGGMIEEVRGLLESGVPEEVLLAYGLEYRFVTLYLKGELDFDEMKEKLAVAIHQFAKRQMTWFRGMERSGSVIHWVNV